MSAATEYTLGLLAFWLGLLVFIVACFKNIDEGDTAYLITDHYGAIYGGEFRTENDAVAAREALIAMGVECWVISIERGSYTEDDQC